MRWQGGRRVVAGLLEGGRVGERAAGWQGTGAWREDGRSVAEGGGVEAGLQDGSRASSGWQQCGSMDSGWQVCGRADAEAGGLQKDVNRAVERWHGLVRGAQGGRLTAG